MSAQHGVRKFAVSLAMFAVVALGSAAVAQADPVTFVLTGADFSGPTANTGGNINVHIQNIAGASLLLFGSGLVGLATGLRKRFRKQIRDC